MASDELETLDESDIDDWLASELVADDSDIKVPQGVTLPKKIRWIASDGAYVVLNQVLATFSPVTQGAPAKKQQLSPKDRIRTNDEAGMNVLADDVNIASSSSALQGGHDSSRSSDANSSQRADNEISDIVTKKDEAHKKYNFGKEAHESQTDEHFILRSNKHGILKQVIHTDTVITDPEVVIGRVESSGCPHSVVIHGLCVTCCQVVEDLGTKRPTDDGEGQFKRHTTYGKQREGTNMVIPGFITSDSAVRVDASVSNEMEFLEILGLIRRRKLCLVLDLDNTLIHSSTAKIPEDMDIPVIDMYGHSNGSKLLFDDEKKTLEYEAELERSILITRTLNEHDGRFFVNYYKLRPGVYQFLRESTKLYDLYLFTMGTRGHANAALKILDPTGSYFGTRIFSRSEANNSFKTLGRIFPNHTNLLLILDDSEHIWMGSPGLIKVYPYYYFTDMQVIRNRDSRNLGRVSAALQAHCNYSNFIWNSVIMEMWKELECHDKACRDDDGFTIPSKVKTQKKSFKYNSLLIANERPSSIFADNKDGNKESNAQKSQKCDDYMNGDGVNNTAMQMQSDPAEGSPVTVPTNETAAESFVGAQKRKIRKVNVKDSDEQLYYVTKVLEEMYNQFYESLDCKDLKLEELKDLLQHGKLPDVGKLLNKYRNSIMKGIVLSVNKNDFRCPLTGDELDFMNNSDIGTMARKFGISPASNDCLATHYLKNNVSSVAPKAGVKKVHSQWLEACLYTWRHVEESMFDSDKWNEPFRTFWDALYASHHR
ncbi:RNA polymerase II CTD phosphatase like protein [Babesia gibsoni]|uniref:protein-serine/threonine phosphatase n=1 Tax=Babesia gibsoni TaxID=33632 RepID=A0AAD8PFG4_BABGI|nr:RNA polymerase II CTD phosphatase like protein [Babesia gibsoni]